LAGQQRQLTVTLSSPRKSQPVVVYDGGRRQAEHATARHGTQTAHQRQHGFVGSVQEVGPGRQRLWEIVHERAADRRCRFLAMPPPLLGGAAAAAAADKTGGRSQGVAAAAK